MQALIPSRPKLINNYQQVPVKSNHFKFEVENLKIYRFSASLQTNSLQDENTVIAGILEEFKETIERDLGEFFITGNLIYSFEPLTGKNEIVLSSDSNTLTLSSSGRPLKLQDLSTAKIGDKEEIQKFLNVVVKSWVKRFGYFEFGHSGKYFRYDEDFGTVNQDLRVLKGFKVSFDIYENSAIKILIDYCTRVISRKTLWDDFLSEVNRAKDEKTAASRCTSRGMFLSLCGLKKLVRVHGMDLNLTASSPCPFSNYSTYWEYFQDEYGVTVTDRSQYLVYTFIKIKEMTPEGKELTKKRKKYFLPEFLVGTGMTDYQKKDYRLMNKVSEFTKLRPEIRMLKINEFASGMNNTLYNPLSLQINLQDNSINGIVLNMPRIIRANRNRTHAITPKKGNFFLEKQVLERCSIRKWTCVYEQQDYDYTEEFVALLRRSAQNNGFELTEPEYVEMTYESSRREYTDAVRNAYRDRNQFILFLLPEQKLNRIYKALQKLTKVKYPMICQGVQTQNKYLSNKMSRGIGDKVVTQIYTKLGYSPWKVQIPQECKKDTEGLMILGADVFHNRGKNSVAAVIGTTDKEFTKYCSDFKIQARGQEIMDNICSSVITCVEGYKKANKILPKKILFYRDGVGEGQIDIVKKDEIAKIKAGLEQKYGKHCPALSVVLVTKRINDRFFTKSKKSLENPDNGLIVYSDVVKSSWEFFMVAQKVTQGSATPTRYQVLHDEIKFGPDSLFNLTYSQCYNYYNWTGAVKVPAVCQLAHTLAYYAGENLTENVHPTLFNNLYFL